MRLPVFFYALLFTSFLSAQNRNVSFGPSPDWVNEISYKTTLEEGSGSSSILLNDQQCNFAFAESFSHHAVKLLSHEGVQQYSDFSVSFDPSYQQLRVHQVKVVRDGQTIDKLEPAGLKILENESRRDRYIYNGAVTAVLNLKDIRKGDILEYSYTLKGKNQAFPDHDFYFQYVKNYNPVGREYFRVLEHPNRPLHLVRKNAAPKGETTTLSTGQKEWLWSMDDVEAMMPDNNRPSWYDPYPLIELSSYGNWQEVVNASLPLYDFKRVNPFALIAEAVDLKGSDGEWEKINRVTGFVQNDIRYLGFEDGRNAYRPHRPHQVLEQRFGDCKGKSYLLAAFYQGLGYEAYPMLVSTSLRRSVDSYTASPFQFNHCVVALNYNDRLYYIDPTISGAGGKVNERNFPAYEKGLILRPGEDKLTELYANNEGSIHVSQVVTVPEDSNGVGQFSVKTEYRGVEADNIRQYFNSNNRESVEKEYLSYYAAIYPKLEQKDGLAFEDEFETNIFITTENYQVPDMWQYSEEEGLYQAESYSLMLDRYAFIDKSPARTMPLAIPGPVNLYINTVINLPSEWNVSTGEESLEREHYSYKYRTLYDAAKKQISINHAYSLKSGYIEAEDYDQYLADHEAIQNKLGYNLSYDFGLKTSSFGGEASALLLSLVALLVGLSVYFYRRLWQNYNPRPASWARDGRAVGGWLFLIALHLLFSPIRVLYELVSEGYLEGNLWSMVFFADPVEYDLTSKLTVLISFVINIFILATQVFLNIAFYSRRSLFPIVFSLYAGGMLLTNFLDSVIYNILSDLPLLNDMAGVGGTLLFAVIFVPAILTSSRAQETFVKTYRDEESTVDMEYAPSVG